MGTGIPPVPDLFLVCVTMSNSQSYAPNQVEPDAAAIRQHLQILAAPAVGGCLHDGLLELAYGKHDIRKAHLFQLDEIDAAVDFALRVNQAGHQVYIGAALRKPGTPISKRANKSAFYGTYFAWADDASDWTKARAAWRDCPPNLIVCTGQIPEWRGQVFWQFAQPIVEFDQIEALNRGIAQRLDADDVINCDRLVRLSGSVNWPFKPNRTMPELVTLVNGAASISDQLADVSMPFRPSSMPPRPRAHAVWPAARSTRTRADRGQRPGKWHSVVRDVIAHLVGQSAQMT